MSSNNKATADDEAAAGFPPPPLPATKLPSIGRLRILSPVSTPALADDKVAARSPPLSPPLPTTKLLTLNLASPVNQALPEKSERYIQVFLDGGLINQRMGIFDAVAAAKILNTSLVIPYLEVNPVWQDSRYLSLIHFYDKLIILVLVLENIIKHSQLEIIELKHSLEEQRYILFIFGCIGLMLYD
nr:O-fucosyltransferase 31-like [Ipomoea batatas]